MTTELTITTERIDDFPLLLATMQRLGLQAILDRHLPRHGLMGAARHLDQPARLIGSRPPGVAQHLDSLAAEGMMGVGDLGISQILDRFRGSMFRGRY